MDFTEIYQRGSEKLAKWTDFSSGTTLDPLQDVAIVTGGARGLGKYISLYLKLKGVRVAVLDLHIPQDRDKVEGVRYYQCDITDRESINQTVRSINQDIGPVTVLVNNAGITTGSSILKLSHEQIDQIIKVNLNGGLYMIKAVLPTMLEVDRGYIVTVSSALGYLSPANFSK